MSVNSILGQQRQPVRNLINRHSNLTNRVNNLQNRINSGNLTGNRLANTQNRLDTRQNRLNRVTTRLDNRLTGIHNRLPNLAENRVEPAQNRANRIETALGREPTVFNPEPAPGEVVAEEEVAAEEVAAEEVDDGISEDLFKEYAKWLFPSQGPLDVTASPAYTWGMKQGQTALDRYYAARGLRNSGIEDAGARDFTAQMQAQETDRWMQQRNSEADRLRDMITSEADRSERTALNRETMDVNASNEQYDRLIQMLELMSRQSPMKEGYDALSNIGQMRLKGGKTIADYIAKNYPEYSSYVSGGGGSQPLPNFIPGFPGGPDTSSADILDTVTGGTGNVSNVSNIGKIISGIIANMGKAHEEK